MMLRGAARAGGARGGSVVSPPDRRRTVMTKGHRVFADCRAFPSEKDCSLYVAGTPEEVLEVAVTHAIKSHGHRDTPQLRDELRALLKDEPAGR